MTGFRLFVPAGWQLLDLTVDLTAQIERAADSMTVGLRRDVARQANRTIVRHLTESLSALKEGGALGYLQPFGPLAGHGIRPVLVIRPFAPPGNADPFEALLALASQSAEASLLDAEHLVGLRVVEVSPLRRSPGELRGVLDELGRDLPEVVASSEALDSATLQGTVHRVRYVLGVPNTELPWVEILASVEVPANAAGSALAEATLGLFDELAKSYEWGQERGQA